jgi:DUF971 family protein
VRDPIPFPSAIDLDRTHNWLEITWEDGARTHAGGPLLRRSCPCAECRGEAGLPGKLDVDIDLSEDELALDQVGLIGQYALQITFRSGHGAGIYTFKLLRGLDDNQT